VCIEHGHADPCASEEAANRYRGDGPRGQGAAALIRRRLDQDGERLKRRTAPRSEMTETNITRWTFSYDRPTLASLRLSLRPFRLRDVTR
jgi:hypothetical protein